MFISKKVPRYFLIITHCALWKQRGKPSKGTYTAALIHRLITGTKITKMKTETKTYNDISIWVITKLYQTPSRPAIVHPCFFPRSCYVIVVQKMSWIYLHEMNCERNAYLVLQGFRGLVRSVLIRTPRNT